MSRVPFIAIDGKRHLWRDILELRRAQLQNVGKSGSRRSFRLSMMFGRHRSAQPQGAFRSPCYSANKFGEPPTGGSRVLRIVKRRRLWQLLLPGDLHRPVSCLTAILFAGEFRPTRPS